MQIPNTQLIKYLLGTLDEREEREISLRIIEDNAFEDEMLFAESELIEAFLEKSLTAEETKLFQTNFLINEERGNQLKEIYLLKKYAANKFQQETLNKIPKESSSSYWESFKALFSANLKPVPAILAILIIALLIGATWRVFFTKNVDEMTPLEKQYAEINRSDLKNSAEFTISPIVLIPGTLRSLGENSEVKSAEIGDNVSFRLSLPFEVTNKKFLKAELVKDKKTVFTQNEVRIYNNPNGQEVKLVLPKSVLQKGQYQIKLKNPNNENSSVNYSFVVE